MTQAKKWTIVELAVDDYLGSRNRGIKRLHPTISDISAAIHSLNGKGKSSMAIAGSDDSVLCIGGGGAEGYHVQVTFAVPSKSKEVRHPDKVFVLCDPTRGDDQLDVIIGSIRTPLPAKYIVDERTVLTAVKHYFADGTLAQPLQWIEC